MEQNQSVLEGLMPALVPYFGSIAQLVERNAINVDDLGSSPSASGRVFVFLA